MYSDLHKLRKGFTLVELIISLALLIIVLTTLLFTFKFQYDTYDKLYTDTYNAENLRYLSITLERQIRATPIIFIVNDRIYLKDLESPEYFNYYSLNNSILFKTKTDKALNSIGQGSTSQIAADIDFFALYYTEGNIIICLETNYNKKNYEIVKVVRLMNKTVTINN
ncbi:prepilin-type N-terminal cleavage/methylation domain-containing protein [Alkalibaculum sp. M08DMB]|uniref:Prepilin-type N-terminal cleavage/methylation domain-containing protein n=1 Tax=Alkalibaculum sporogenes TaxID=2655001 RepID=A0A6A7K6R7_9FIRM|nr:prepilin-type N-terminal cleavage/methylation domain-containing protein [Alkalibaculum sporogenes]MPW25126.1 prepilin-type N-terminal cleavage/methylation domain-containing protein [Alkalibaculum sporogenes]